MIVPASFNFPHTGKLLSVSFILFAAWFADVSLRLVDYPQARAHRPADLLRQPERRGAVPARPVPHPGRHVPALSGDRRHQRAVRGAARRAAHGRRGAARQRGHHGPASLRPGSSRPLRCRHRPAHRRDHRRVAVAVHGCPAAGVRGREPHPEHAARARACRGHSAAGCAAGGGRPGHGVARGVHQAPRDAARVRAARIAHRTRTSTLGACTRASTSRWPTVSPRT